MALSTLTSGLVEAAAIVGAAAVVLGAIARASHSRPVRWVTRRLLTDPLAEALVDHIGPVVEARLQRALAELVPNGGSSLRDAVDRIEERVVSIDDRVSALEAVEIRRRIAPEEHP